MFITLALAIICFLVFKQLFKIFGEVDEEGMEKQHLSDWIRKGFGATRSDSAESAQDSILSRANKAKKIDVEVISVTEASLPAELRERIDKIKLIDPEFDSDKLIAGAKKAINIITEATTNNDRKTLEYLLTPEFYTHYCEQLDKHTSLGYKVYDKVLLAPSVEISSIEMSGRTLTVDLHVTTQRIKYTVENEAIVDGSDSKIVILAQHWFFTKEIGGKVWQLCKIIDE